MTASYVLSLVLVGLFSAAIANPEADTTTTTTTSTSSASPPAGQIYRLLTPIEVADICAVLNTGGSGSSSMTTTPGSSSMTTTPGSSSMATTPGSSSMATTPGSSSMTTTPSSSSMTTTPAPGNQTMTNASLCSTVGQGDTLCCAYAFAVNGFNATCVAPNVCSFSVNIPEPITTTPAPPGASTTTMCPTTTVDPTQSTTTTMGPTTAVDPTQSTTTTMGPTTAMDPTQSTTTTMDPTTTVDPTQSTTTTMGPTTAVDPTQSTTTKPTTISIFISLAPVPQCMTVIKQCPNCATAFVAPPNSGSTTDSTTMATTTPYS